MLPRRSGWSSVPQSSVFAQTPTPTPKPEDLPFHLVIRCLHRPNDDSYRAALDYWSGLIIVVTTTKYCMNPGIPVKDHIHRNPACCSDRPNSNVTQHLATANYKDLKQFLETLNQ